MRMLIDRLMKNEKQIILALVALAFLFRLVYVYAAYSRSGTSNWSDDWEYLACGRQIATGNWNPITSDVIPFMQVAPGLPMLVAASLTVFGAAAWPIFLYNILITSMLIAVLFHLGKLVFGRDVGWLLALWGVFYPEFTRNNPHILKEPTIYFFFSLTVLLLLKSIKNNGQTGPLLLSVLSYAWMVHVDERYLMYAPLFLLAFLLIRPFSLKRMVARASIWGIFLLLLLTPWTIRNYHVFKQVVLISPRTTAITGKIWGKNIMRMQFGKSAKYSYQKAVKEGEAYGIKPRSFGHAEMYARAFINFWQPTYFRPTFIQNGFRIQKWSLSHNLLGLMFYGIFLPFFVAGVFLLVRHRNGFGLFLAAIPFLHSIAHTIMVWPLERFRSPVVFCVVGVGTWALLELLNRTPLFRRSR